MYALLTQPPGICDYRYRVVSAEIGLVKAISTKIMYSIYSGLVCSSAAYCASSVRDELCSR